MYNMMLYFSDPKAVGGSLREKYRKLYCGGINIHLHPQEGVDGEGVVFALSEEDFHFLRREGDIYKAQPKIVVRERYELLPGADISKEIPDGWAQIVCGADGEKLTAFPAQVKSHLEPYFSGKDLVVMRYGRFACDQEDERTMRIIHLQATPGNRRNTWAGRTVFEAIGADVVFRSMPTFSNAITSVSMMYFCRRCIRKGHICLHYGKRL